MADRRYDVLMADAKVDAEDLRRAGEVRDESAERCAEVHVGLYRIRALRAVYLREEKEDDKEEDKEEQDEETEKDDEKKD